MTDTVIAVLGVVAGIGIGLIVAGLIFKAAIRVAIGRGLGW